MRILKDEDGQALALAAISLTALMGVMALAIDVGYMEYQKVQLQTAADSAAIAAGLEIGNCGKTVCSNMETAAGQALIEDGITSAAISPAANQCTVSTSTGLAMIINVAPCVLGSSDPNFGNANMAEVVLTEPQSTFFGSILGVPTFNLVARAEAGEAYYISNAGGSCIYTHSIIFNSNNNLNLNCGIYDGGNLIVNTGAKVTASSFTYTGTYTSNCNGSCTWKLGSGQTQPTHTNSPTSDPLAAEIADGQLVVPAKPSTTYTGTTSFNSGTNNLSPGYYASGLNVNGGTINLSPGLYYFNSSFVVNSNIVLECTSCTGGASPGTGVTLYFKSGAFIANSDVTYELSAPSSGYTSNGDVANMLIWQGASNSSGLIINSAVSAYLNGIIYAPDAQLTMNSNSTAALNSSSTATAMDVKSIIFNSGIDFDINSSDGYLGGSAPVLGAFALAE
ncbi:MAG: pilus assembly protein TadG-related protein [Terracidiphilus sp.]